jgi:hypothetical protein
MACATAVMQAAKLQWHGGVSCASFTKGIAAGLRIRAAAAAVAEVHESMVPLLRGAWLGRKNQLQVCGKAVDCGLFNVVFGRWRQHYFQVGGRAPGTR